MPNMMSQSYGASGGGMSPQQGAGGSLGPLPAAYGQQLFTNIQAASNAQGAADRQGIIDNTAGNPAMGGATQALLRQQQQKQADGALSQATSTQLQGAQAQLQNNQITQGQQFQGSQNDLNRQIQYKQLSQQLQMQNNEFNFTSQQADIDRMQNMFGSAMGAAGGM